MPLHRDLISCGLIARGWVMSWRLLLPERSCGLLGLITLPGGRPTGDGALTPGVAVGERSRTTTPERRGPILTASPRQPRLQPWPCLCRCEYLRQCTASVRSSASAACRIPAGALMVIELAGDVVRKITRPALAVIVSKSGRMSSSWKPPPAATSIACFVFRLSDASRTGLFRLGRLLRRPQIRNHQIILGRLLWG